MVTKKKIETKWKLLFIKRCKCKGNKSKWLPKNKDQNETKVIVKKRWGSERNKSKC